MDLKLFLKQALYEGGHYTGGHPGMEGDTLRYYFELLPRETIPVLLFSVLGWFVLSFRNWRMSLLTSIFPVVYFIFIASFPVRNERTLLPILGFVILFASYGVTSLAQTLNRLTLSRKVVEHSLSVVIVLSLCYQPLLSVNKTIFRLKSPNSRDLAREWIVENLPPGSSIALERYSPYVDPKKYHVEALWQLNKKPPEWFKEARVDYIIASGRMYGRFFRDPVKYSTQHEQYRNIFSSFKEIKRFKVNGPDVRVFEVPFEADKE